LPLKFLRRLPLAFWGLLCVALAGLLVVIGVRRHTGATAASQPHPLQAYLKSPISLQPKKLLVETQKLVPPHTNFSSMLASFDLTPSLVQQIIDASEPVYDLRHIRAGNSMTVVKTPEGDLRQLRYQIDTDHQLSIQKQQDQIQASIQTIPSQTKVVGVSGKVAGSLFGAIEQAGEQDQLALDLANIFGWDIDFYTDTQPGDVFRVVVEKKFQNGRFVGYGRVLAAEYVNGDDHYDALLYHDEDGQPGYYMPDGKPMKREFLRSPLKFAARITSGFTYHRYHPILKRYRAHLGIDFAAPIGTPVQTIGSGVVVRCGRFGGDGNMVQIKHSEGYQTLYLHLSKILVRRGEHVAQGERIGLVGMTGLATGPHLDFRIEHNGQFENFEVLRKKLPPAAPVSHRNWPQFAALRSQFMPELAQLQPGHPQDMVAQAQPQPKPAGR